MYVKIIGLSNHYDNLDVDRKACYESTDDKMYPVFRKKKWIRFWLEKSLPTIIIRKNGRKCKE